MVDPVLALSVFAGLVLLSAGAYWLLASYLPSRRGVLRRSARVLAEDALKQLLRSEGMMGAGSLDSVAGALEAPRGDCARTLDELVASGLARIEDDHYRLTVSGRETALQILRAHRLWERYLADRTGVDPSLWHVRAETMEHSLGPEGADALATRLGHPRYDPHGDPIPTSSGRLPPPRGRTLRTVEPGSVVEILHMEDEPEAVFDELLSAGLALHQIIEVLDTGASGVRVRVDGRDETLSHAAAGNLSVELHRGAVASAGVGITLDQVADGDAVRVVRLRETCTGPQRRRLLDLGVVPGTEVVPELRSASGDPVAYRVRGALIALREQQARWIEVEPLAAAPAGPPHDSLAS